MIVLIGFMGAGKSVVGRELARLVRLPFVDVDQLIEDQQGRSIAEIFADGGEASFRALEREATAQALDGPEAVIALGGGAVEDPATQKSLEWANVVYLDVPLGTVLERIEGDVERPMLAAADPTSLFHRREPIYRSLADLTIHPGDRPPAEIAAEIISSIFAGPGGASGSHIRVELGERSYLVHVGSGVIGGAAEALAALTPEKTFVVSQPSLAAIADPVVASLADRGLAPYLIHIPEGETAKSMEVVDRVLEQMAGDAANRNDAVLTIGGGVVTDLGGFVASIYARGIPVVHCPTSLLAQVDAAVGGKTGVNLSAGKNLVGTFHQPSAVFCDVDVLTGLAPGEYAAGWAEVIKCGLIADPEIISAFQSRGAEIADRDPSVLSDLIAAAVRVKASIVAGDEHDRGSRAFLNYGHTFAHAIELKAGYGQIRHGEAVAIGMVAAAYLALEMGRIDEDLVELHERTLVAANLPTRMELTFEDLEQAWRLDKKYDRGVRFVLLNGLAQPEAGVPAEPRLVKKALERMSR